jgi:hypothetical protein
VQAIVVGSDEAAQKLFRAAVPPFALNKTALCLPDNEAAPQNLPPALRETIPHVPGVKEGHTVAIVCSGFSCQPPVSDVDGLNRQLREAITAQTTPSDASAAD